MAHPTWLPYSFAVLMMAVSVYCVGRLALAERLGRRNHYDVNISHVLMGTAMIGMLVPRWNQVPNGLWEVVFGVMALYFLAMSIRAATRRGLKGTTDDHVHNLSQYLAHMVMGCAMLYMYWLGMPMAATSSSAMSMKRPPGGAGDPSLTLLIIVVLFASAIWRLDSVSRLSSPPQLALNTVGGGGGGGGGREVYPGANVRPWLAPRLDDSNHIAMCLAMGYMLILML